MSRSRLRATDRYPASGASERPRSAWPSREQVPTTTRMQDASDLRSPRLGAAREFPSATELAWFEWTAASCSSLATFVLLALAADPDLQEDDVIEAEAVYFPWICAASTLLDAYVDQASDRAEGNHSYVEHYDSPAEMVERLCEIVYRSVDGARRLRNGERHALIAAGHGLDVPLQGERPQP